MDDATKAALASLGAKGSGVPPGSVKNEDGESSAPFDLDALLEQSLDEVPDVPDFNSTPKEGIYRMKVDKVDLNKEFEKQDGTKVRAIQLDYTLQELIEEKGTSTGDPVKPGDRFSQTYFLSTEKAAAFAIGQLKKLLEPVAARVGTTKVSETIKAFEGCEVAGVIKHRRDKNDRDVVRASVIRIVFLD